jgi:DNA-binding transcriptional MerR regulator
MMGAESEGCTMLTITEVSRSHGVSARMLRYYEQQGLIVSQRREDYAYRVYDEENIARLRLILVLRKLRVPLKSIAAILTSGDAEQAVCILREKIAEIEAEQHTLETIRETLTFFVERIGLGQSAAQRLTLLVDETLLSAVNALGQEGPDMRLDIIEGLNRFSSCVYILFCRTVAGKYEEEK